MSLIYSFNGLIRAIAVSQFLVDGAFVCRLHIVLFAMRLVISAQEMENFIENVETPLLLQISGKFTCQLKPAYAVVLAIFEEVKG